MASIRIPPSPPAPPIWNQQGRKTAWEAGWADGYEQGYAAGVAETEEKYRALVEAVQNEYRLHNFKGNPAYSCNCSLCLAWRKYEEKKP